MRASDFNPTLADQRTNGHLDFLKEGVRLYTDGNADTGPRTDGGTGDWNTDKVQAAYDAGVLTLRIPIAEKAKPRKIEVTGGGEPRKINA